jgi:hypothetical protein
MSAASEKLYTYVDETGQDTEGEFFLVATVIVGNERDGLLMDLENIERQSGKGGQSWRQTHHDRRIAYVDRVLADHRLHGTIFYGIHQGTRDYQAATIETIIRALNTRAPERRYKVTVIVDGLHRAEWRGVAVGLRHAGIPVKKVRASRDQTNALGRLADAMAGFIRDGVEGVEAFTERLGHAQERNWIRMVL